MCKSIWPKKTIDRVKQLRALANEHDDLKAMQKAGLYIGWTKGDFRTHELAEPLNALMAAIFDYEDMSTADREALDNRIMDIWTELSHTSPKYTYSLFIIRCRG